jgi:hypothetical protein
MATNAPFAQHSPRARNRFYEFVTKYPAIAAMGSIVLLFNLLIDPNRFADYYQYLVITDGLVYFYSGSWIGFEAGSNLILLGLRFITGDTITAVNLAHYLLGATYIYLYFLIARDEQVGWRGVLISFALYGSLLAFVTIRATPAYLLVVIAALRATRGQTSAIWLALAATLFHVSAVLAVPPIIIGVAQNRLRALDWVTHSTRALVIVVASAMLLFGLLQAAFANALNVAIEAIPFLGKYVVYTAALDPLRDRGGAGSASINHLIYAVTVSLLVLAAMIMPEERCRRLRAYALTSYAIFLLLQFSPITAYRQSQFWTIPLILVFPWHRFVPAGFRSIILIVACLAFFAFTAQGVYG